MSKTFSVDYLQIWVPYKISAKYSKNFWSYGCLNAANLGDFKLAIFQILIFFNFDSQ